MWSTDQNGPDSFGDVSDITVQWSMSAEPAISGHSGDPAAPHSLSCILAGAEGGKPKRVTWHHNLIANGGGRNPAIGVWLYPEFLSDPDYETLRVDFRNNVVYNWGGNNGGQVNTHFHSGSDLSTWQSSGRTGVEVNMVGNRYIPGPNSSSSFFYVSHFVRLYVHDTWSPLSAGPVDGFAAGIDFWNVGPFTEPWTSNSDAGGWYVADSYDPTRLPTTGWNAVQTSAFQVPPVTTHSASAVFDIVLGSAGATKPARDAITQRVIDDVRNGTGGFGMGSCEHPAARDYYLNAGMTVNSRPCVYPTLASTPAPPDADGDGMPDAWESGRGLDPNDGSDGRSTSSNGYTNLENYLNELAGDPVP
jgi:hypothetical protein